MEMTRPLSPFSLSWSSKKRKRSESKNKLIKKKKTEKEGLLVHKMTYQCLHVRFTDFILKSQLNLCKIMGHYKIMPNMVLLKKYRPPRCIRLPHFLPYEH